MATAQNGTAAWNDAVGNARKALALEAQPREIRAAAYDQLGIALSARAAKDRKELEAAVDAFRKALALEVANATTARFDLGIALLRLDREDEGKAALRESIAKHPDGPTAEEARATLADPRRARESFAPAVSMTTLAGKPLTTASLHGKVVLLDFWATWCAPCVAALPEVKALAKTLAGEPFVVVGVSADFDREKLRKFVAEKGIDWPQVWEKERRLVFGSFKVNEFPTYMILDPEGKIVYRRTGWAKQQTDEQVTEAVRKTLATSKKSAVPKGKAAP